MFTDATLYVGIAVTSAIAHLLGTDDAAKFVDAQILFWVKGLNGAVGAGFLALKMFRSDTFARYKANGNSNSPQIPKP